MHGFCMVSAKYSYNYWCRLLRFLKCELEDWCRQIVKSISWLASLETSFFDQ